MNVSLITPTWNRADKLPAMFRSVLGQNHRPLEHIVVDNLSTDDTAGVVADYARRAAWPVRHVREADHGLYDAMNKGIARAEGDALYFLNDDDRLLESRSLDLLARCLARTGADFACADVWVKDAATGRRRRRHHRQINRLTLAEKSICQQAILYRREAFAAYGMFDAGLRMAADYDWTLRVLVRDGGSIAYLRHAVAEFTTGGLSNAAEHRAAFEEEMAAVRRRYFTGDDLRRAKTYRRVWRKLPWGRLVARLSGPVGVRRISRIACGPLLLPDPLAWPDF